MDYGGKLRVLEDFYTSSFRSPVPVADVSTSGSYAHKVRSWSALGSRSAEEVELLCQQVNHLRCAFKIMDDLIDEDEIRDHEPAFWTIHSPEKTVAQSAWHLSQARLIAGQLRIGELFEQRLCEVIAGARLEVEMEDPDFASAPPTELWLRIVEKEAAFRRYLAEALGCSPEVCQAAYDDGIAAQVLDDARSALYGKDGRPNNSDEQLDRLTYMRAYGCSAQEAEQRGMELKAQLAPKLKGELI